VICYIYFSKGSSTYSNDGRAHLDWVHRVHVKYLTINRSWPNLKWKCKRAVGLEFEPHEGLYPRKMGLTKKVHTGFGRPQEDG
jgi:hypothetical protein